MIISLSKEDIEKIKSIEKAKIITIRSYFEKK
jgi:hypothetical protein